MSPVLPAQIYSGIYVCLVKTLLISQTTLKKYALQIAVQNKFITFWKNLQKIQKFIFSGRLN